MDNDPYTADASLWLATVAGDSIIRADPSVTMLDGTSQTDVNIVEHSFSGDLMTVWLSGGVPGSTYLVTWKITTLRSRVDYKSIALQVVATRS